MTEERVLQEPNIFKKKKCTMDFKKTELTETYPALALFDGDVNRLFIGKSFSKLITLETISQCKSTFSLSPLTVF